MKARKLTGLGLSEGVRSGNSVVLSTFLEIATGNRDIELGVASFLATPGLILDGNAKCDEFQCVIDHFNVIKRESKRGRVLKFDPCCM
jgi:hypothetical protein